MPLIPNTKLVFNGDKGACQYHIKFATSQLAILERLMSFQKLNEGRRVVSPYKGVTVECLSKFGKKEVRITVVPTEFHIAGKILLKDVQGKDIHYISEENEIGLYFFRVKYQDPDINDYEVFSDLDYSHLYSDRIIIWEIEFDKSVLVKGVTSLFMDVDVVNRVVYFPVDLTVEETVAVLATADSYILRCPSQNLPTPPDVLEDLASELFTSGGLSSPIPNSVTCGYGWPLFDTEYTINTTCSTEDNSAEYSATMPNVPRGIDGVNQPYWESIWCPDPLVDFYGNTWFGISEASEYVGTLISTSLATPIVWRVLDDFYTDDDGAFRKHWVQSTTVPEDIIDYTEYLKDGTWFDNKGSNSFNCFFLYNYFDGNSTSTRETYSFEWFDEGIWKPWYGVQSFDYSLFSSFFGIVTPLETISVLDFISNPYGLSSCSEEECFFNYFLADFNVVFNDDLVEPAWHFPCSGHNVVDTIDITRRQSDAVKRFRDRLHISEIADVNLISLSHYQETRALDEVWVEGSSYPKRCDTITGSKTNALAEFGYIVYIFSPIELSWINASTETEEYWNIYDERVSQNIINPNRCLDVEEYVNDIIGEMQLVLDSDLVISKLSASNNCAYPLMYYGYGITDGFLKV